LQHIALGNYAEKPLVFVDYREATLNLGQQALEQAVDRGLWTDGPRPSIHYFSNPDIQQPAGVELSRDFNFLSIAHISRLILPSKPCLKHLVIGGFVINITTKQGEA
jgi:hypothetical protein